MDRWWVGDAVVEALKCELRWEGVDHVSIGHLDCITVILSPRSSYSRIIGYVLRRTDRKRKILTTEAFL